MGMDYEVQVWHDGREWRATVYLIQQFTGERLHELSAAPHHEYLGNVMNYIAQAIDDYEREGGL